MRVRLAIALMKYPPTVTEITNFTRDSVNLAQKPTLRSGGSENTWKVGREENDERETEPRD